MPLLKNHKIFISGAGGYIGQHLFKYLSEHDVECIAFTRRERPSYFTEGIWIQGNILDYEHLKQAMQGCTKIVHLACSGLRESFDNIRSDFLVNGLGTVNVLQASHENEISGVIYISTEQVYGNNIDLPLKESTIPKPDSPYATSKLIGESYCSIYDKLHNLCPTVLRVFNVYGSRINAMRRRTVENIFIENIKKGNDLVVQSRDESRDFIHIDDVVQAIVLAINSRIKHEIINIGSGRETTILALAHTLKEITQGNVKIMQMDKGKEYRQQADTHKAQMLLNFVAKTDLRNGLSELVENYNDMKY